MTKVSVVYVGKLSSDERACIQQLLAGTDYCVDESPDHVPRFAYAGGFGAEVPLAWLAITFVGTGVTLFLKSFIETLGSEAAKKLTGLFARKHKAGENEPAQPVVFIVELRPNVAAIIPLQRPNDLAPRPLYALETKLQAAADTLPPIGQHLLYAFKTLTGDWEYVVDTHDKLRPLVWDSKHGIFLFRQ